MKHALDLGQEFYEIHTAIILTNYSVGILLNIYLDDLHTDC